jgi:tumor protein p53-inducible protein 3
MDKWVTITGSTLQARSLEYKVRLIDEMTTFANPHFQNGSLKPVVGSVYPFEQVINAHKEMEANQNIGKIILTPH